MVTISAFSRSLIDSRRNRLSPRALRGLKLIVGAVILYLFVAGNMGAWHMVSLWRAEQALTEYEADLFAEVINLDTKRRRLLNDTTYIENIARTEYNLSRSDEIIYIVDESAP